MSVPAVTVLTTVRNGAAFLPATLDSVLAQTFQDWEHVIVDDGSDDDTPAILERYAARDPRFRIASRDIAGGPYRAANDGLERARGRFVLRIDGDDIAAPGRIDKQMSFLNDNPRLRACTTWWWTIGPDGTVSEEISKPPSSDPVVLKWAIAVVSGFVHSTLCIERAALTELGGYEDIPVAADYALWCAAMRRDWVGVVPDALVAWRRHGEQMSEHRFAEQRATCARILAPHMHELTGRSWTVDEAGALWSPGRWLRVGLAEGFDALDRWDWSWRADTSLVREARRELYALSARVRVRHARYNRGGEIAAALRGVASWVLPRPAPRPPKDANE